MQEISNEVLTVDLIPPRGAAWDVVSRFALTLNGYPVKGQVERHGNVTNLLRSGTLMDLRAWLFFRQRMQHYAGYPLDEEDMAEVYQVLDRIRSKVAVGELS